MRINDCDRRLNYYDDKLLRLSKLEELIPTYLLDTVTTIADKRSNKITEQHNATVQSKLTRLQHAAHKKRHKKIANKNWVRDISSRPLDENEMNVLSYGLNILFRLNTYQPTVLYRVFSPLWLTIVDTGDAGISKESVPSTPSLVLSAVGTESLLQYRYRQSISPPLRTEAAPK